VLHHHGTDQLQPVIHGIEGDNCDRIAVDVALPPDVVVRRDAQLGRFDADGVVIAGYSLARAILAKLVAVIVTALGSGETMRLEYNGGGLGNSQGKAVGSHDGKQIQD
jgi:hypothetical protein